MKNGKLSSKSFIAHDSCVPSGSGQAKGAEKVVSVSSNQSNIHTHDTRFQKVCTGFFTYIYLMC